MFQSECILFGIIYPLIKYGPFSLQDKLDKEGGKYK